MTKRNSTGVTRRNWAGALLLGGLLGLPTTSGQAQEAIGSATAVKPQAQDSQGPATRTLSVGSTIYSQDNIHTGDSGVADLRFHDSSNLNVGPKSEVRLDKFVYDPNRSAGSAAVEVARGSFRFVTGPQSAGVTYQIKTPFGTLGVRG
ncbi:MAG TPA: FecR domain-containing protein [Xanthobacteraceae bacterium]|jgi:hypothetical protein